MQTSQMILPLASKDDLIKALDHALRFLASVEPKTRYAVSVPGFPELNNVEPPADAPPAHARRLTAAKVYQAIYKEKVDSMKVGEAVWFDPPKGISVQGLRQSLYLYAHTRYPNVYFTTYVRGGRVLLASFKQKNEKAYG